MSSGVLVVAFTSLTIGSLIIDIDSQEPPQAPQVQTKNKTDSALERDKQGQSEKGNSQNTTIPKAQVSPFIGDDKSSGDSRKSDEEGHEFLPPLFGYKVKVTDAFLSLFTLGLFIATWFLYRATRDLVRGAEKTSKRQLRAYIIVEPGGISNLVPREQPSGRIMVRNSGQTPAYEVEVAAKIQIVTVPPETDITDSAPVVLSGDMAIVPNGHRHVAIALNDMIVSPEFDDVFNEKRWIIMFGCVKYIDAFGEKQKSRFCHLYQGMTLSAELVRYHHLGNGAT